MDKRLFCLLMALCLVLCACGTVIPEVPETAPRLTVVETLPCKAAESTTAPTELPAESPTAPAHSPLYLDGVPVEDVIAFFNEVCLDAEIIHSGDPSLLQKWTSPIFYTIHGDMTPEDYTTFTDFVQWLNTIEGFPGIQKAQEPYMSNLDIHFCSDREMLELMGAQFFGMDGAVTFWYENDEIYDAIICYRTDLHQKLRNSVILEEIYNGLGPVQDTALRSDSIIYAEYSEPQMLSAMDELILKLLYHPQMKCGMNRRQCEAVIRELYY